MAFGRWLAFFISVSLAGCRGDENEYRLVQYLMANYDRSVRPSRNASEALNVTFGLALTQIIDVDERNQILTTNCWMNQMWVDNNLVWNPSDFGNIRVIRIPAEKVWKPDIILYNNADSEYNSALLSTNVIVTTDGNITWLSSAIFKSSCAINVEYFPFDEQKCSMKFSSWTYDGLQVNLLNQADEGDLSNYVVNGEWDLIDLVVERNVVYYSCCEEPYPDITYHIVLRRRPLFYVFNLILPCVLITGIALMSFYMPSDSGEKVTLGITTLLSMTVFLMVIGESMPPTSEKLPLIGLYYGVTISLVSFATGLSVVTLNIHHRGMRGRGVPPLVKKIVFGVMAKILCIRLDIPDGCPCSKAKDCQNNQFEMNERFNYDDNVKAETNGGLPHRFTSNPGLINNSNANLGADNFERQFLRVLNKVYQTIERNEIRLAEQDRRDAIKLEWQQVALVIDRFLLWVFIISTVGATFGILYMSPHTKLFTIAMLFLTAANSALKIIFFVHLVFVTWGLQSGWAPLSYFFYNLLFLVILLWGMHQQDSEHPVSTAFFMNVVCVFLDVVTIGVFFPSSTKSSSAERFSAGMAIVNLLLRPVSAFLLYRILQERHSQYSDVSFSGTAIGNLFSPPRRGPYEDIDRMGVPSQPVPNANEPGSPGN